MNDPDEDLVRRARSGDRGAIEDLVRKHQRRVYNIAFRMLGREEDAADASQEVFLTCIRKLSGFQGRSAFSTWLYRVTVNACYDTLRKRAREAPSDEQEPPPQPDHADAAAAAADVQRALLLVPEDFRAVLVLHDVRGLPYEEVAEALGAPVGTIKSRLHRARVALARALRGEPPAPGRPSNLQEAHE